VNKLILFFLIVFLIFFRLNSDDTFKSPNDLLGGYFPTVVLFSSSEREPALTGPSALALFDFVLVEGRGNRHHFFDVFQFVRVVTTVVALLSVRGVVPTHAHKQRVRGHADLTVYIQARV